MKLRTYLIETYSKVRIGQQFSDVLRRLLFNFVLEYAIKGVEYNEVGFKFNGTHQHQVYAGDVNLLGDTINMNTM
jgi:hypothetical protein